MMDIMIVTGMSGAGKTFAGSVLEDFGYYCIDNIPVSLLSQFIDLYSHQEGKNQKIALIIDVRVDLHPQRDPGKILRSLPSAVS